MPDGYKLYAKSCIYRLLNIQRCNRDAERYTFILHVAQRMLVTVILSYVILTFLRTKMLVSHNTLNIKAPMFVQ